MVELFSEEWAREWCRELNRSEAYHEAAETWEGAIVLVVEPDPSYGVEEEKAVLLDLRHGECRGAGAPDDDELGDAPYLIRADPYTWKRVLHRDMDPITGLVRGKFKVERGSVMQLARYVRAAKELVAAATRIETAYPEGWE